MNGIWKYSNYFTCKIQEDFQISLNEGNTPLETYDGINKFLHASIYFKREDLNPTGSHKDRNAAVQISYYYQQGEKELCLSSSGNNGISAIAYTQLTPLKLTVFLPVTLSESKAKRIQDLIDEQKNQVQLCYTKTPKRDAFRYAKEKNIPNIIPSEDERAVDGQSTLGLELAENPVQPDAIFMPTSSGTGLMGIYRGYKLAVLTPPQLHIVQTSKVHPLAAYFDHDFMQEETSLANAIVTRTKPRAREVVNAIEETKGSGWVIENALLEKAHALLEKENVHTSYDAALSLAGLMKAQEKGLSFENVVCVLTGK